MPCDDDGHGTHTMGTMVGDDDAGNQIGMAPGARWIGYRNMNQGVGTPASYAECFQWFVAPTDLAGQNPDPSKVPHAINSSWACPPSEGCTDPLVLETVVTNVRNAGIVVVVSAGKEGPNCNAVQDPPPFMRPPLRWAPPTPPTGLPVIPAGDQLRWTARGEESLIFPPLGSACVLAYPGGGYASYSGTSMAGPHVAGGVVLLLSAVPVHKGQVNAVEQQLVQSAFQGVQPTGQVCGGIADNQFPNNTNGYGWLDVSGAVRVAEVGVTLGNTPDPVNAGGGAAL